MTAEIVNLRKARKHRARKEDAAQASRNRALFGRTKTEQAAAADQRDLEGRRLDGHKRDRNDDKS